MNRRQFFPAIFGLGATAAGVESKPAISKQKAGDLEPDIDAIVQIVAGSFGDGCESPGAFSIPFATLPTNLYLRTKAPDVSYPAIKPVLDMLLDPDRNHESRRVLTKIAQAVFDDHVDRTNLASLTRLERVTKFTLEVKSHADEWVPCKPDRVTSPRYVSDRGEMTESKLIATLHSLSAISAEIARKVSEARKVAADSRQIFGDFTARLQIMPVEAFVDVPLGEPLVSIAFSVVAAGLVATSDRFRDRVLAMCGRRTTGLKSAGLDYKEAARQAMADQQLRADMEKAAKMAQTIKNVASQ